MDDVEYMYKQDLREKKSIAAAAKHRKGKVIGPKGCRLPSDYLTKKERNAMNGPITTYDLGKPVNFRVFKGWPTDIQKEYILRIDSLYQPTNIALGAMLGVHTNTVNNIRKTLGIPVGRGHHRHFDEAGWKAFINGETVDSEVTDEAVESMNTEEHIEALDKYKIINSTPEVPSVKVDRTHIELHADSWDAIFTMLKTYDISEGYHISVAINKGVF